MGKALWYTYRYHTGTIAFGSLILTIIWFIRAIFEYLANKLEGTNGGNGCTKCLLSCSKCCLDCFDRFVRFINLNAYVYCAISSEGFCNSAMHSFLLMLKNTAKFFFVEGLTTYFVFMAKVCISLCTTVTCYFLLETLVDVEKNDVRELLPLTFVFFTSYLVASVFLSMYEASSATILMCYLLDHDESGFISRSKKENNLNYGDHVPKQLHEFMTGGKPLGIDMSKNYAIQESLLHANYMN